MWTKLFSGCRALMSADCTCLKTITLAYLGHRVNNEKNTGILFQTAIKMRSLLEWDLSGTSILMGPYVRRPWVGLLFTASLLLIELQFWTQNNMRLQSEAIKQSLWMIQVYMIDYKKKDQDLKTLRIPLATVSESIQPSISTIIHSARPLSHMWNRCFVSLVNGVKCNLPFLPSVQMTAWMWSSLKIRVSVFCPDLL